MEKSSVLYKERHPNRDVTSKISMKSNQITKISCGKGEKNAAKYVYYLHYRRNSISSQKEKGTLYTCRVTDMSRGAFP